MDQPSLRNPLTLVTTALAVAAWIILFVGGCVAQLLGVSWWIIIFQLVFVVCVIVILALGKMRRFQNMVNVFLAIGTVYLTYLCQGLLNIIDHNVGARAAAAGAVILIIVEFVWCFQLTAPTDSALTGNNIRNVNITGGLNKLANRIDPGQKEYTNGDLPTSQSYNSPANPNVSNFEKATAQHEYQGSSSDPQELSFSKGEEIEILDKRGNWWQARKADGTTGIVPSNYNVR
ncbi:hypothetical protein K501DRAFT_322040 [Backusella circina FSU 941]|nr:hypothetical protein K501DRAFT_322040 [Backusella circina FSU 941]